MCGRFDEATQVGYTWHCG